MASEGEDHVEGEGPSAGGEDDVNVPEVCFIFGEHDLTEVEFQRHYAPPIITAWRAGCDFVVSDERGCAEMAIGLLRELATDAGVLFRRVTVFHMFEEPRRCADGFRWLGGFTLYEERDADMTRMSQRDIAWQRPGRDRSSTAANLRRRKGEP